MHGATLKAKRNGHVRYVACPPLDCTPLRFGSSGCIPADCTWGFVAASRYRPVNVLGMGEYCADDNRMFRPSRGLALGVAGCSGVPGSRCPCGLPDSWEPHLSSRTSRDGAARDAVCFRLSGTPSSDASGLRRVQPSFAPHSSNLALSLSVISTESSSIANWTPLPKPSESSDHHPHPYPTQE